MSAPGPREVGECLWANQICEQPNHHGCTTCLAVEPVRPDPAVAAQIEALRQKLAEIPPERRAFYRSLGSAELREEMRLEQLAEERKAAREGR